MDGLIIKKQFKKSNIDERIRYDGTSYFHFEIMESDTIGGVHMDVYADTQDEAFALRDKIFKAITKNETE